MKAIEETIKFLQEIVIECEPNTGCGRCDDARKLVLMGYFVIFQIVL